MPKETKTYDREHTALAHMGGEFAGMVAASLHEFSTRSVQGKAFSLVDLVQAPMVQAASRPPPEDVTPEQETAMAKALTLAGHAILGVAMMELGERGGPDAVNAYLRNLAIFCGLGDPSADAPKDAADKPAQSKHDN